MPKRSRPMVLFDDAFTRHVPPLTLAERLVLLFLAVVGTAWAIVSAIVEAGSASSAMQLIATAAFALFAWRPWVAVLVITAVFASSFAVGAEAALLLPWVVAFGCTIRMSSPRLITVYCAALLPSIGLVAASRNGVRASFGHAFVIYAAVAAACGLLGLLLRLFSARSHRLELQATAAARKAAEIAREERTRIADDLHDVIAHDLVAIVMQAHVLARTAEETTRQECQAAIVETARKALTDIRKVVGTAEPALDGGIVSERGIHEELAGARSLLEATGHRLSVVGESAIAGLTPVTSNALGRALREAVTNIAKHGGGGPVELAFDIADASIRMRVSSRLPSKEPPATSVPDGYGLARMSERAKLLGGTFSAGVERNRWIASLSLPLPAPTDDAPIWWG